MAKLIESQTTMLGALFLLHVHPKGADCLFALLRAGAKRGRMHHNSKLVYKACCLRDEHNTVSQYAKWMVAIHFNTALHIELVSMRIVV